MNHLKYSSFFSCQFMHYSLDAILGSEWLNKCFVYHLLLIIIHVGKSRTQSLSYFFRICKLRLIDVDLPANYVNMGVTTLRAPNL